MTHVYVRIHHRCVCAGVRPVLRVGFSNIFHTRTSRHTLEHYKSMGQTYFHTFVPAGMRLVPNPSQGKSLSVTGMYAHGSHGCVRVIRELIVRHAHTLRYAQPLSYLSLKRPYTSGICILLYLYFGGVRKRSNIFSKSNVFLEFRICDLFGVCF